MQEPVRIVITMEGGVIQSVASMGVPVNVTFIDYDTDGVDPSETVAVPQDQGPPERAYLSSYDAELWSAEVQFIADLEEA
jgi:hypothetical protein